MYDKINWCIAQHVNTNHMYDTYLPYEFHLRMVAAIGKKFAHLLNDDEKIDSITGKWEYDRGVDSTVTLREACLLACWGHDLIEDTRTSYNDVKSALNSNAAEIIYAVTNEKGKNRKERANNKYYEGIRNTPGAVFVKLCDRIANVQYGKMTGSRQVEMYEKENENFIYQLGYRSGQVVEYAEMYEYLRDLFKNK